MYFLFMIKFKNFDIILYMAIVKKRKIRHLKTKFPSKQNNSSILNFIHNGELKKKMMNS